MKIRRNKKKPTRPTSPTLAWFMAATAMMQFSVSAPESIWAKEPNQEDPLDRKGRPDRWGQTPDDPYRPTDRRQPSDLQWGRSLWNDRPWLVAQLTEKDKPIAFDIPPQPLMSALLRFGEQTDVQVAYTTEDIQGLDSAGVSGVHSVEAALALLLANTGIHHRLTGANTITLEKVGPPLGITVPPAVGLAQDQPSALEEPPDKPIKIKEIVVRERKERPSWTTPVDGYKADYSSSVTRGAMPIVETPVSIGVVTRDLIKDTFARTQMDAFEAVSGVTRNVAFGRGESFSIRGFAVGNRTGSFNALRSNGLPIDGVWAPDWGIVERYEIVKGPASIIGGAASPGGVINRITKTPQRYNFTTVESNVGSYDFYRGLIDTNGVMPNHENIRGRMVFAVEEGGNFVDFTPTRQYTAAPSVEFDFFKGAGKLLVLGMYQHFDGSHYPGYPLTSDGNILPVPRTRNFGGGASNGARTTFTGYSGQIYYNHQFIHDIKLTARGTYSNSHLNDKTLYFYSPGGIPPSGDSYVTGNLIRNRFDTYAGELFLSKGLDLLGQKHEILAGVDYRNMTQHFLNGYMYLPSSDAPILDNVFNPRNFLQAPADSVFVERAVAQDRITRQQLKQTGAFAQGIVRPFERLTLVFAGRHDWAEQQTLSKVTGVQDNATISGLTGRFGATFKISPWMNVYGGVQQSFLPQFGLTSDGNVVKPETGINYEVGAKINMFQDRLLFTTALFRTYRENVASPDPNNNRFVITIGEQRHQGVEFDVNGQPIPGLNLNANFAYLDAKITEDTNPALVGQRAVAPEYVGRVFCTYQLQSGPLEGFGFGGGVYFVGDYDTNLGNRVRVDAYERVDGVLFYRGSQRWDVSVNVRNLLNAKYIENPGTINWANRFGAPITAVASLRVFF